MDTLQDYYIKYFTLVIFILGFIFGVTHVFSIMQSYETISEYAYNEVCQDTFGKSYYFDDFNAKTGMITCYKKSNSKFSIKRIIHLN